MNTREDFKDKRVIVLGLARSGEAAVKLLIRLGAHVLVSDQKGEDELKDIFARLKSEYPQVEFHLGGHPEEIFEGADLVVVSPGVPFNIPVLESVRDKGIPVIGEIELAYRVCKAPIIAITGTKGKSTTSTLTGQILSKTFKGGKVVVAGNIGIPLSQYVLDLTESDLLVLVVSSFQLETTVHFRPAISVILNIMTDHMDRHKDFEEYYTAKRRIFANQTKQDYIVLNADDRLASACASLTDAKVVFFSSRQILDKGVYLKDGNIVANLHGNDIVTICRTNELKIPGRHNLENAMTATAVSMIYGAEPESIAEVLRTFNGLEHALEFAGEANGIRFIDDSKATNVVSLKAALESIEKGVILIIGGRDKGNDYTQITPLIKEKVKHLVIIGESADKIQNSLGSFSVPHRAGTMDDAVSMAYKLAESGDTVLLSTACASFDMFRDYAERGRIFKEAAKRIVEINAV
ncbi:MAG: UDP-N-acetylmuramoylalanine--D-glutamate ligase [Candidatus Poribacteria bacterium]|nr:UDP-N-acetylmuramoylalanine--D-glutamate ligase [Candidatus Poribacteria bacterium]